jgi:hypothetical protein
MGFTIPLSDSTIVVWWAAITGALGLARRPTR